MSPTRLQTGTMSGISVLRIDRLELTFAERPWTFAEQNRAKIDAHFAARQQANPTLWNGRVLMLQDHAIEGAVFRGTFIGVDFASLLTWQIGGGRSPGPKTVSRRARCAPPTARSCWA
jgi:hypothetical protein